MKKELLLKKDECKLIYGFSPQNISECNEWYSSSYNQCIKQYSDIILSFQEEYKIFMISQYQTPIKLNAIDKRGGMIRIFAKCGKEYKYDFQEIKETEKMNIILSAVEVTKNNVQNFFVSQIENVICVVQKITELDLFTILKNKGLELLKSFVMQNQGYLLQFNDIGCDGNNINIFGNIDLLEKIKI